MKSKIFYSLLLIFLSLMMVSSVSAIYYDDNGNISSNSWGLEELDAGNSDLDLILNDSASNGCSTDSNSVDDSALEDSSDSDSAVDDSQGLGEDSDDADSQDSSAESSTISNSSENSLQITLNPLKQKLL